MTNSAYAELPQAFDKCGTKISDISEISDNLKKSGWKQMELPFMPAFGKVWGDYKIINSIAIEGLPNGTPEQQREYLIQGRDYLVDRDLKNILHYMGGPDAINADTSKSGIIYYHNSDASSWVIVSREKSYATCEWFGNTNAVYSNLTNDIVPSDLFEVFEDIASLTSAKNENINTAVLKINSAKFVELMGYSPNFTTYQKFKNINTDKDQ
ncbi:hypothetical protein F9L33_00205 [Amylibacter sp. SFDW26]|uniref:hypothetical protein n=1 Tax=Amylibacter sp. SFDW26 TaxID=2652722 RepID=UPI0012616FC4|nr:hypothetical protein [Amylibacter sp. SFDW26]KAB7615228.1 hypothetical protein F9L33_00205 [Amylibacter sp. SFDW26]